MKKVLLFLFSISVFIFMNSVNSKADDLKVVFPGEYIEYEVSFMGITLGSIIITTNDYVDLNGKKVVNAKSEMKSAKGIPFVDLQAVFESWFNSKITFSEQFFSKVKESENSYKYENYRINNGKKVVKYEKLIDKDVVEQKVLPFESRVLDGCSLFFFARQFTDIKKTVRVPTLMNQGISYTNLNFHGKKESTKIDAVSYPVKCLYFDGRADWEGIYGLKGYFQGWFSDDEARVPIRALMNVYVGNVEIKLVKWKRGNWQPPKGN